MLFWLGSIEFNTPWGTCFLTGDSTVRLTTLCRRATEEEAAQIWPFIKTRLVSETASYDELQPLYELYRKLTSEPLDWRYREPTVSLVLHAIESALRFKQLFFEIQKPFDPLPEPEWEPIALEKLRPSWTPAQTPSELWGRRETKETFIGIRMKDQVGAPISASRVRVQLPDGSTKEATTDADGELLIAGLSQDGNARITFLDYAKPGKAEAPEWPEDKEFKVKVVDEIGNPVSGIWLYFRHGNASNLALTDRGGVATYETSSDVESVDVSFESADDLAQLMKPIWNESRGTARKDWVQADDATTTVSIFGGKVVKTIADDGTTGTSQPKETLEPFMGVETTVDNPVTLSVQPLVIVVRMLGELFDTDKCFLLPKALGNVKDVVKLHEEYGVCEVLITGHTDTSGQPDYNLDLSLERANAMSAYLTNYADAWLEWYGEDKKQSKRWGTIEDSYMIETLLTDSQSAAANSDSSAGTAENSDDIYPPTVLGYQQWHNAEAKRLPGYEALDEDGKIGPITRKQLILDYMHREDTTVPAGTPIHVHGCGEYFPLDSSGENLDANPADGQHEQEDRRVEVFLFPREVGVLPPVPGAKAKKGEKEYPEWRYRAVELKLQTSGHLMNVKIWLLDVAGQLMVDAPYRMTTRGQTRTGRSDPSGAAVELGLPTASSCYLEWGEPEPSPDDVPYRYEKTIRLPGDASEPTSLQSRLENLGYYAGTNEERLSLFAKDFGQEDADEQRQQSLLIETHDKGEPRPLTTA